MAGGKGGDGGGGSCGPGRTIVLLADRKHHCTTTGRESGSRYLNVFRPPF